MIAFIPEEFESFLNVSPYLNILGKLITDPNIATFGFTFFLFLVVGFSVLFWASYVGAGKSFEKPLTYAIVSIFLFWMLFSSGTFYVYFYPVYYNPEREIRTVKTEIQLPLIYTFLEVGDLIALNFIKLIEKRNVFIARAYLQYCVNPEKLASVALYKTVQNYTDVYEFLSALFHFCNQEKAEKFERDAILMNDLMFPAFAGGFIKVRYNEFEREFNRNLESILNTCSSIVSSVSPEISDDFSRATEKIKQLVKSKEIRLNICKKAYDEYINLVGKSEIDYSPEAILRNSWQQKLSKFANYIASFLLNIGMFTVPAMKILFTAYSAVYAIMLFLYPFFFLLAFLPDEDNVLGISAERLFQFIASYAMFKMTIPLLLLVQLAIYSDTLEVLKDTSLTHSQLIEYFTSQREYDNLVFLFFLVAIPSALWTGSFALLISGFTGAFARAMKSFERIKDWGFGTASTGVSKAGEKLPEYGKTAAEKLKPVAVEVARRIPTSMKKLAVSGYTTIAFRRFAR